MSPCEPMRADVVFALSACLFTGSLLHASANDESRLPEMALIQGATFTMGTPIKNTRNPKYHSDEAPLKVTVKPFKLGKYPITAEQMCEFLNSPAARELERDSLYNHANLGEYAYSTITFKDGEYVPRLGAARSPANQVTWKGAVLYCRWLSEQSGQAFRLPTEAEWELAARGRALRTWPWGNEPPDASIGDRYDDDASLNAKDLADRMAAGMPTWSTTAVGSHPRNSTPDGVQDMLAYVIGEWCANKYMARPTADQMVDSEIDLNDLATARVVRGYYHRAYSRGFLPLTETPRHGGRTWTRVGRHPIDAVKHAARYGFRVAQDVAD